LEGSSISSNLEGNPFASLFPTLEVAVAYRESQAKLEQEKPTELMVIETEEQLLPKDAISPICDENVKQTQDLNNIIEEVFLVTLNKYSVVGGSQQQLVHLSSLAEVVGAHTQQWLDLPTLEQAIFERLMLENPGSQVVTSPGCKERTPAHLVESRAVVYLAECYRRLLGQIAKRPEEVLVGSLAQMQAMVVQNLATALREPDLYPSQDLPGQLMDLVVETFDVEVHLVELLGSLAVRVREEEKEGGPTLESLIHPILDRIKKTLVDTSMIVFSSTTVHPIQYFLSSPLLARVFVLHSHPKSTATSGKAYEDTLLGAILGKSCLPSNESDSWNFFSSPSAQPASTHAATEGRIWAGLESVHASAHVVLRQLLRVSEEVKHLTLLWLGNCLSANEARGKMWTSQMGPLLSATLASDGFMLNFGSCLLKFCKPLTSDWAKMSKVEASYVAKECLVTEDSRLTGVHMRGLHNDTCLVPLAEGATRDTLPNYSFTTEIFFMAHKAIDLGFRTVQEKFVKLNQELGRLQNAYRDTMAGGGGAAGEQIQTRMETAMQRYLTYKAALLEPTTLDLQTALVAATSDWLVSLATGKRGELPEKQVVEPPPLLSCVPEMLVENSAEHLLLVRRFQPHHFEQAGEERLGSILTGILCFMDQPSMLRNPHLRARLAESLECLLPSHETQGQPGMLGSYQRQAIFQDHRHSLRIAQAILHVFVSIEETGQAVQFEQKFSYRRPMYDVIKYIWQLDPFKQRLREMAEQAEEEIESETPPLFLRFLNLLINDAIFLLDEGLSYMKQIQEKEGEREGWSELPAQERAEAERGFQHTGQLARYHNLMGGETIGVLELLTSSITAVITHPTLADRLAAMLNYFLKTLTGPESKSFKVSNLEKYSFRPGEVVGKICQIYLNLGESSSFVAAVSRDGRSYSPTLFPGTERVLVKVGRADLAAAIGHLATLVGRASSQHREEEELLAGAPDEFLCPIMSILMTDPVRLPSSKQVVDRSTIARHLLSDQSDPFNRAPLTMDQVEPETELRQRVEEWMASRMSSS